MFLIEQIENVFQLVALGILTFLTIYRSVTTHNRIWGLLSMFYATVTLGNLYWFLYMMFYQETPFYDFIPDFCWMSSVLFMVVLLLQIRKTDWNWRENKAYLLIPVFTFAMALFYMRWGEYLSNIAYAIAMTILLYCSLKGLFEVEKESRKSTLYFVTTAYCMVEYCLWTASCFSWEGFIVNPYLILDIMLTLVYIAFYPAAGRVVRDELH